jgi:hypothetical protein
MTSYVNYDRRATDKARRDNFIAWLKREFGSANVLTFPILAPDHYPAHMTRQDKPADVIRLSEWRATREQK